MLHASNFKYLYHAVLHTSTPIAYLDNHRAADVPSYHVYQLSNLMWPTLMLQLMWQIDAAINPGNSGGPAFLDLESGQVAGVAFSKSVGVSTDNIGYLIPHQ